MLTRHNTIHWLHTRLFCCHFSINSLLACFYAALGIPYGNNRFCLSSGQLSVAGNPGVPKTVLPDQMLIRL